MTKPRDPDALLSAYLADGMTVLPDRVVDAVLDEVHRTRQRHALRPWRTRSMSRMTVAAAAVVAVIALGGSYFIQRNQPAVAGPSPTRSADPSPILPAVVAPDSTPSEPPTPSELPGPSAGPTSSAVPAGAGAWIATGPMITARFGHTSVRLLDGRVLVAGGKTPETDLSVAELYDPDSGTWSATGNMLHPHDGFAATLLRDGKVLVGDALDDDPHNGISGAEVYDPATGAWSSTGKLAQMWFAGSTSTTATLLANGKVLVAGVNGSQLYDPDSGNWTATGKMITPRYNHAATLLPDGRVLVAGGDVNDVAIDSAELYDPETGSWTAAANMPATRNKRYDSITATLLLDGRVLVVRPSSAALYDPASGTWTRTGDMARPDTPYGTATRLLDGRVLVAGGSGDGTDAALTAEVYDPATGSWTETASMLRSPISGGEVQSATLLPDGTVLVSGGAVCSKVHTGCPTGATGSAELYIPAGVSPPTGLAPVPSPTPSPSPTPIPTPFPPASGPVPAGARPWQVTVVNKSSKPATLFLAEEDPNGVAGLCGSVTPNVVPAGVTQKVTFQLPPRSMKSCWVWVNPIPRQGGSLFQTSDAPLKGGIHIDKDGQVSWG